MLSIHLLMAKTCFKLIFYAPVSWNKWSFSDVLLDFYLKIPSAEIYIYIYIYIYNTNI